MVGLPKRCCCFLNVLLLSLICQGSTEGTEYSLSFLPNLADASHYLHVTTSENWSVPFNITAPELEFSAYRTVRYGEVVEFTFHISDYKLKMVSIETVITVSTESDGMLNVYGSNLHIQSSDSYLALPKQQDSENSYKYFAASYSTVHKYQESSVLVIVQFDNTQLTITSKVGAFINGTPIHTGATTSISAQEGESFLIWSEGDLTGMKVVSNRPLAMLSGHECTNVPVSISRCDHLVEQIPPVSSWGWQFITAPLKDRTSYDVFRILASENLTEVVVNCMPPVAKYMRATITYMIDEGNFMEFRASSDQYCFIEGNGKILVLQYSTGPGENADSTTGDPTMIIVPAITQYTNDYSLPTIQPYDNSFSFSHYMNLFIPAQYFQLDQIILDNQLLSSYNLHFLNITISQAELLQVYTAQVDLTQGVHTLYHVDTEATLGVVMYGFGPYRSYGHPGGLNLAPVIVPAIIGFKMPYQQVREEEGEVSICLVRKGKLERNDTVIVFTPQQGIGEHLATGFVPISKNVTFFVGASEMCFGINITMNEEVKSNEHFSVKVMDITEGTEVDKGSNTVMITIVSSGSPCPSSFLFPEIPVNSQVELPCSHLDSSFLPGGMITATCLTNSTWGPMDMSQCTFRSDVPVAAVAVVEALSLTENSQLDMEAISSSYVDNITLKHEYFTFYGARVWVYSLRLNSAVGAKELQDNLAFSIPVMITRVVLTKREDFCSCCDGAAVELSARLIKTTNSCTGSYEAPMACSNCLNGISQCQHRFGSVNGSCFLDFDRDGKPDYEDPCVGCCLPDYDLAFEWNHVVHGYYDEVSCAKIHPSFTDTKVRRRCRPDDSWEPADISSCTFKNNTKNPIFLLTTRLIVSGEQDRNKVIEDIKRIFKSQLPNFTKEVLLDSSAYNITLLETTSTYSNGTNVSTIMFVVEFDSSVELIENISSLTEEELSSSIVNATYQFMQLLAVRPADSCPCQVSSGYLSNLCIGTSISPCDCRNSKTCKCIDPYVDDDASGQCSLDIDGDMIPDYRDDCAGVYSTKHKGCPPTIDSTKEVLCPAEEDTVWKIQWPEAAPISTQSVRCPGEGDTTGLGLAHRSCLAGGVWGPVDASDCESLAIRDIRIQTESLNSDLNITRQTGQPVLPEQRRAVVDISLDLRNALNTSRSEQESSNQSLLPGDLQTSTKLLMLIAELGKNNELFKVDMQMNSTEEQEEIILDIVNSLLYERNEPAFRATAKGINMNEYASVPPAVQNLESTEKIAHAIASSLTKANESVALYRSNIAVQGQVISFDQLHEQGGIHFPGEGVMLPKFSQPSLVPNVILPPDFVLAARGRQYSVGVNGTDEGSAMTGLVNTVWNNIENYLPITVIEEDTEKDSLKEDKPGNLQTLPASLVVSSQIPGYTGGEVNTNATVEIMFPIKDKIGGNTIPSDSVKQFRCAFFNFTGGTNGTGGWSYRGVKTKVINDTHVRCSASHLTSFAVLVSVAPAATVVSPLNPLNYITYIGCGISFLCLLASIGFFISLRKELIHKPHNFVHLNFCIALSLGLLLFLTGIQTAAANVIACKVVTALLHYFFLATFTWTLCEAVLVYILLVRVFDAKDKKWIYLYLALGWVLPIPIVAISAGSRHNYYLIRHSFNESSPHYNQVKACWLPRENGMIFAFVGPMIAIIVVNAVLLTFSLVAMARTQSRIARDKSINKKKEQYTEVGKSLFKAIVVLIPLLGFTWIIGLFAVGEEGKVFAYLFVIANVFQGVLIFLFHVLRHEKVSEKIKSKFPNLKCSFTVRNETSSNSGAITHSTLKSKELDSFKFISSAADTEAVPEDRKDQRVGGPECSEKKGALEQAAHLGDDETETCDKELAIPATSSLVGLLADEDDGENTSTQPKYYV